MKTINVILLALPLFCTLFLALDIHLVEASGTIYIRADGSIDPSTAPVQQNGNVYTLTGNITSDADGYVLYGCALLGTAQETFDGNGTLCQIEFVGVSPGKTALAFSGPEGTFLLDHNLNEIRYGAFDGISAVEGLYCDLNNDQRIDIADISAAAQAFCSYPGHPRWNPAADINGDNKVNIVDLALIAGNFAKSS